MHVGFSLLTLSPGRATGGESIVRGVLREFADGHGPDRVTVLANREAEATLGGLARGPVTLTRVRSYRPGRRAPTRALAMAAARLVPQLTARAVPRDLDVLHYPLTVPIPTTRLPSVVTIHDVVHHDLPHLVGWEQRRYRRWAYDQTARRASAVITISEFSRERLLETLGLEPQRVVVAYPGIDHDRLHPQGDDDARALDGLDLPERFVIYPANLWPHKNHERLLEGLRDAEDSTLHLVLTGQVYRRLEGLMDRARELGVGDRVHHLGFVSDDVIAALYRRARAMVFPSLYEGFGLPPIEAMACGCPVAASTRGSLDETCAHAARIFDPDDSASIASAIDDVANDEDLRSELRAKGLEEASRFTWRATARVHHEVYEDAAARG